jgi:hypothetical protein
VEDADKNCLAGDKWDIFLESSNIGSGKTGRCPTYLLLNSFYQRLPPLDFIILTLLWHPDLQRQNPVEF